MGPKPCPACGHFGAQLPDELVGEDTHRCTNECCEMFTFPYNGDRLSRRERDALKKEKKCSKP